MTETCPQVLPATEKNKLHNSICPCPCTFLSLPIEVTCTLSQCQLCCLYLPCKHAIIFACMRKIVGKLNINNGICNGKHKN